MGNVLKSSMGNASSADRALYSASRQGDADKMKQALKDGANVNFVADPHGRTPLHVSAAYNKKDGCRLLLTAGSDLFVRDKAGNTPAELAKEKKIELWRFLDDKANGRAEAEYADDEFERPPSTRGPGTPVSQAAEKQPEPLHSLNPVGNAEEGLEDNAEEGLEDNAEEAEDDNAEEGLEEDNAEEGLEDNAEEAEDGNAEEAEEAALEEAADGEADEESTEVALEDKEGAPDEEAAVEEQEDEDAP